MPDLYAHLMKSFLLSVLLILVLRPLARELQLVDRPDTRKRHSGEIPVCGGVAIFAALILSQMGFDAGYWIPWTWIAGLGGLMLIGLADDRWQLAATPRLALEFAAAAVLVSTPGSTVLLVAAVNAGEILQLSGAMAAALSVVFVVGVANAVNMQDGLDGVAGTSSVFALLWLGLLAAHAGDGHVYLLAPVLAAAILGFLVFNMRHPWRRAASIFLGDAGSLVIGAMIALFILRLATGPHALSLVSLLWIVAVPVIDTCSLIVRRLASGRSPLSADRWHLHHLLLDAGVPHAVAAQIVALATALCGSIAFVAAVWQIPDAVLALGLLLLAGLHSAFVVVATGASRAMAERRHGPTPPASAGSEPFAAVDFQPTQNLVHEP
jgi:UDP-GlcNAc:undecaprenyl-phosphate GlcNAc-1-phosphate transferase